MTNVQKIIVVLLIIATVSSIFSIIITLSLNNLKPIKASPSLVKTTIVRDKGAGTGNLVLNIEGNPRSVRP